MSLGSIVPREEKGFPFNLVICGVGGQGNVLGTQVIARAAVCAGLEVATGDTLGVSQRGGSVLSHVRLLREKRYGPLIPRHQAAVILGFEPLETLRAFSVYGNPQTKVLMNARPNYPLQVLLGESSYPSLEKIKGLLSRAGGVLKVIDAAPLALKAGSLLAQNIVLVGALTGIGWLPLPEEAFQAALKETFSPGALSVNRRAFQQGLRLGYLLFKNNLKSQDP